MGGTALNLAIPTAAYFISGVFFGHSYPKIFLHVALALALPISLLMIAILLSVNAEFFKFDIQLLSEGFIAAFLALFASTGGSYIGKRAAERK